MSKNQLVTYIGTFILATLWVVLISILVFRLQSAKSEQAYVVDVARVMASYTQLIDVAAAGNDLDAQVSIVKASKDIEEAIREIAGSNLVLVSASVVSGDHIDITDVVILSLGLNPVPKEKVKPYEVDLLPVVPVELKDFNPDNIRKIYKDVYQKEADEIKAKEKDEKVQRKIEGIIP